MLDEISQTEIEIDGSRPRLKRIKKDNEIQKGKKTMRQGTALDIILRS